MLNSISAERSPVFDLLDALDTPIFFKDLGGTYVFCNGAFSSLIDRTKHYIIGKTDFDLAPQSLAISYREADRTLFEHGGKQVHDTVVMVNDKTQDVRIVKKLITTASGTVSGVLGQIFILTESDFLAKRAFNQLTEREKEIMNLLLKGGSAKSIANVIGLSTNTVNGHLKNAYKKLKVHSKNAALHKVLQLNSYA
jgi:DNA-binding CsgD family transcriptional regulator